MRRLMFSCLLSAIALAFPATLPAATLTVCASGCAYTDLQPAIDAAQFGDTILLRAGETFVGHYILRAKAGTGWITIRSDASTSSLPPAGTRLVPSDRAGGNTSTSLLPRILGKGGTLKTTALLRTEAGAHGYRIQYVEFDGAAHLGYETLVMLGADTAAAAAYDLVLDHVYIHGHQYKGQKRAISLNSGATTITDSYITDIKAVNADSQAIAAYNGTGPYTITNNYLEAAGENVLFGGSDPAITNLVPADAMFRRNLFTKPLSWRNPILSAPGSVRASAQSGGALPAGTHYFRVVAIMTTGTRTAVSAPSAEVSATVAGGGKVALSWAGVSGADQYRIYRGSSAGAESVYLQTGSAATSFTYTGSNESAAAPAARGTMWTVKNTFEIKNGERITLDGNIFENCWAAGQFGYAIVLTPRNSGGKATWARVKDIVLTSNLVRHASGIMNIAAYDDNTTSGRTDRVTVRHNVFVDIDPGKWGGSPKAFLLQNGPSNIVIDHNTIVHTNTSVVYASGTEVSTGFVYTNNLSRHGKYGIMGGGSSIGLPTLAAFFPQSKVTCNVLAGGKASLYPVPNNFPTEDQFTTSFVDYAGANYQLKPDSVVGALRCGSAVVGADFTVYAAAQGGAATPPPVTSNAAPTAFAGGPYSAATGQNITADASASRDSDGTIASYRWLWGDRVLVRAAELPAAAIRGTDWTRITDSTAAAGAALQNPNKGAAKRSTALAAPASYVEFQVMVASGTPYQLWMRARAGSNSSSNDSLFVQFSGAVTASGAAQARLGTTGAVAVVIEEGSGAGLSGWGWNDGNYGALAAPVYFAASGLQTVRIQQREDGIVWDQFVLTSAADSTTRPGLTRNDATVLASSYGTSSGVTAQHAYARPGVYAIRLAVTDNDGASGEATAKATIASSATAASTVVANAGGPYTGGVNGAVSFEGTGSQVPSGTTAQYSWTFGDDIVLHASELTTVGSRWRAVSDTTAADGSAVENPNVGAPKAAAASAAPGSYVEGTFHAAAGVPYRIWLRMRAANDDWANDSVYVQFSGSVTSTGTAAWRIGTSNALAVILEDGKGAGVSGWGWNDSGYGTLGAPVYFNADGEQTIRIQQREDGVRIDQIIISTDAYYDAAPGSLMRDATIVPLTPADGAGVTVQHAYRRAATYPVLLRVRAGSVTSEDSTTVTIK